MVGDYLGNYKYATEMNDLIISNLAKSDIVCIILPLLQNWLMFRKTPSTKNDGEIQGLYD